MAFREKVDTLNMRGLEGRRKLSAVKVCTYALDITWSVKVKMNLSLRDLKHAQIPLLRSMSYSPCRAPAASPDTTFSWATKKKRIVGMLARTRAAIVPGTSIRNWAEKSLKPSGRV